MIFFVIFVRVNINSPLLIKKLNMPIISTLNFGGINDSPTEFYDASNKSTKEYFDAVNVEYNRLMNTPWGTLRSVLNIYFDDNETLKTSCLKLRELSVSLLAINIFLDFV